MQLLEAWGNLIKRKLMAKAKTHAARACSHRWGRSGQTPCFGIENAVMTSSGNSGARRLKVVRRALRLHAVCASLHVVRVGAIKGGVGRKRHSWSGGRRWPTDQGRAIQIAKPVLDRFVGERPFSRMRRRPVLAQGSCEGDNLCVLLGRHAPG